MQPMDLSGHLAILGQLLLSPLKTFVNTITFAPGQPVGPLEPLTDAFQSCVILVTPLLHCQDGWSIPMPKSVCTQLT